MPKDQLRRIIDTKKNQVLVRGAGGGSNGGGGGGGSGDGVPTTFTIQTVLPLQVAVGTGAAGTSATMAVSPLKFSLALTPGGGIQYAGGGLAVDIATNSGLTLVANGTAPPDSAGGLALGLPSDLSAGSANSVASNTHSHNILASSNPGAGAPSLIETELDTGRVTLATLRTPLIDTSTGQGLVLNAATTITIAPTTDVVLAPVTGIVQFGGAATGFSLTTAGAKNLTIAPGGDVVFNPGGNDILPLANYDLNLGAINKKYLSLHAAELWVETLVAQETIATIGGRILVGPTTTLTADLGSAAGDTTITVKHNQMKPGDRVYMEAQGKVEFMYIVSGPIGGGPYEYIVSRNYDGTGRNAWIAGDAIFNTGQRTAVATLSVAMSSTATVMRVDVSTLAIGDELYADIPPVQEEYTPEGVQIGLYARGNSEAITVNSTPRPIGSSPVRYEYDIIRGANGTIPWDWPAGQLIYRNHSDSGGFIDLYSIHGVKSDTQYGPTVVGNVRVNNTFNGWEPRWAIGNLDGLYDYGVTTYGFAAGQYANGWISADATHGLRIMQGVQPRVLIDMSGDFRIRGSDGRDVISLMHDGRSYFSGVMMFSTNGEIRQGTLWNASLSRYISDDGRELTETTNPTTGVITISDQYNGLRIWQEDSVGLMAGYRDGVNQWRIDANGAISAGSGNIVMQKRGLSIYQKTGVPPLADDIAMEQNSIAWYADPYDTGSRAIANIVAARATNGNDYISITVDKPGSPGDGGAFTIERITGGMFARLTNITRFDVPGAQFLNQGGTFYAVTIGQDGHHDWFTIADSTNIRIGGHVVPSHDSSIFLGTDILKWSRLYVDDIWVTNLHLSGDVIESDVINASQVNSPVINTSTGAMLLSGEEGAGTFSGWGTIDGVQIPPFYDDFNTHKNNTTIHHNRSHNIISTADHFISSGVAGTYLRVSDANTFGWSAILDADLPDTILRNTVTVVAGGGLFGGGALSGGTVTLNVGAGALISVQTDSVGIVNSPVNYGFIYGNSETAPEWRQLSSLAGNGLIFGFGSFIVNAGNLIDVSSGYVEIVDADTPYRMIVSGATTTPIWQTIATLAGAGMTSAIGVLNVVATAGGLLTVLDDSVGITVAGGNYKMIRSNGSGVSEWQDIATLAGAGLTPNNGVLDIGATDATISVGLNSIGVNQGHTFVWAAGHQFQSTVQITGNLTTGNVFPSLTDTWDIGSPLLLYRNSFISTMNAVIFAKNTAQLIGGWFIIPKHCGTIGAVASGATQVDLGDTSALASVNDWILIRSHNATPPNNVTAEYMKLLSNPSGTLWNVQRDVSGGNTPDPAWADGTPYMLLGHAGDGRIEMYAVSGQPRISFVAQGSAYNLQTELTRIGDLNGVYGFSSQAYGFGTGEYGVAGRTWITIEPTNGFRIGANLAVLGQWKADGTIVVGQVANSQARIEISGGVLELITKNAGGTEATMVSLGPTLSKIGGFTLTATALTAGVTTTGIGMSTSTIAFWAGNVTPTSAPFQVTQAGLLTATNTVLNGTLAVGAGTTISGTLTVNGATTLNNVGALYFTDGSGGAGGSWGYATGYAGETFQRSIRFYVNGTPDGQVEFFVSNHVKVNGDFWVTGEAAFASGTATSPSIRINDLGLGFYRVGTNKLGIAAGGAVVAQVGTTGLEMLIGSVTEPSLAFASDLDTGMYRVGSNKIGFATGGVFAMAVSANAIENTFGSEALPAYTFSGDGDTGMWHPNANEIALSTGGTNSLLATNLGVTLTGFVKTTTGNIRNLVNVAAGAKYALDTLQCFVVITSVAGSTGIGGVFWCSASAVTRMIGSASITTDGSGTTYSVYHDGTQYVFQNLTAGAVSVGIWFFSRR